jgi:serine/threonine-protein kinase
MPDAQATCQECGAPLDTARTGGVCAACLLLGAAGTPEESGALGRIGGHDLIEVIARGGMGIVYRARQTDPEREVALKALPGAELTSDEARQRFKIEAQAMARLDHPHILPVHEIGEEDGTPFFTMKLATGGTLAQRVGDYAGKWREIAELIATLAEAVQFAHSRGVLHRDLKPGNVLFDEDGTMYVSDFGLAKLIGTDTDLTRTIAMMGTPTYLAPELVNGGKNGVSAASDVWSLGVMLYELLAGRPPFQAENVAALLRQIAEAEPPALMGSTRALACTFRRPRRKDPTDPAQPLDNVAPHSVLAEPRGRLCSPPSRAISPSSPSKRSPRTPRGVITRPRSWPMTSAAGWRASRSTRGLCRWRSARGCGRSGSPPSPPRSRCWPSPSSAAPHCWCTATTSFAPVTPSCAPWISSGAIKSTAPSWKKRMRSACP